jgi:hypothetical protein
MSDLTKAFADSVQKLNECMTDRERMKLAAITNKTFEFIEIEIQRQVTLNAMAAIPAKLFRKDKPKIDKRRYKRYHKNSKTITINMK